MALGLLDAVAAAHTILTPNAELAAALSAAVERSYVDEGRQIWPTPQIHDFGSWLRQQYLRRQFTDPSLPRCLTDVEEREFWHSVVLESSTGSQFLEPSGAARAARRARRAMFDYGIPLTAIESFASDESLAFLEWNRDFETRCREHRCISSDQLPAFAPVDAPSCVWIDNPVWRPQARHWLEHHGIAQLPPHEVSGTACVQVRTKSPEAEAAAIAEWAGGRLRAEPNFRAWICLPDLNQRRTQIVDALDAVLAPQRFSLQSNAAPAAYAVAGGTSLAEFAPVRAALDLVSATIESVPFDDFSVLLRLPALQATSDEENEAARLDLALRDGGPSEARLDEWLTLGERLARQAVGTSPAALQRLRAAWRVLHGLSGQQPLSRWVALWIKASEAAPWSQRHRWSSTEFQAAERFRELLAALATADALFGPRSAASAHALLCRAAQDTAFQAKTGVPPIWVSGQLMDPWLKYDGVWIAGCSEAEWPPPVDPIPLLPVQLQRAYGVVSAGVDSQLRFAEDLGSRFKSRGSESVFSCADPGDGRAVRSSPLLQGSAVTLEPKSHPHWHRSRDLAPRLETVLDERAPPFAADERTGGVATLQAQSRCAFRGFAETRLRTARLERPLPGFNQRERGVLLHRALEHVWRELGDWQTLMSTAAEPIHALLERSAALAISAQARCRDPGTRWRLREQTRLAGLLAKWLETERGRSPFKIAHVEGRSETLHAGGLDFEMRIDRVDELEDGARALIDYKTGGVKADWRGERPDNPQLPMYALLHPERLIAVAYGQVNATGCCFVPETERALVFSEGQKRPTKLEEMPSFAALVDTWSLRIHRLAAAFAAGHAEVAPTASACRFCSLQPLCRVPSALDDDLEDANDAGE